jgi:hypothetical protein
MTIQEIERQIVKVGSLLATAELQYELEGCFSEAGRISAYEIHMLRLKSEREQKRMVA